MDYLYRLGWWLIIFVFFNIIILVSVEVSIFLIRIIANVEPGEDVIEPFVLLILFAIINLIYILMALLDIFDNSSIPQSRLDKVVGLAMTSIILFFIPVVIHVVSFIWSMIISVFTQLVYIINS